MMSHPTNEMVCDEDVDIEPLIASKRIDGDKEKSCQHIGRSVVMYEELSKRSTLFSSLTIGLAVFLFIFTLHGKSSNTGNVEYRTEHNLVSVEQLNQAFDAAKEKLYAKLRVDYGSENFQKMFFEEDGTSRGRTAFISPNDGNVSWDRLKRKMTIKVLRAMHGQNVSFVWASGGHSAAASHGNFFNQSYTAYMHQDAVDIFASIGIEFVGRNYAVGGMSSAPEVALCADSIFGLDIDVLSWDYGMTGTAKRVKLSS